MRQEWGRWLERGRQEWASNPRLRLGTWLIAGILGFYLLLVLRDWQQALQQRHVERSEYLQKMRSLAGQDEWIERAETAARIRKALEAEIPDAATLGLAQAGVQTWVRDMSAVYGTALRVQTEGGEAVPGRPDLWRVPVVLSGSMDPQKVTQLIQQIEKHGSLTVIEQSVILNRENQTFSLTAVSFFRIQQASADASR